MELKSTEGETQTELEDQVLLRYLIVKKNLQILLSFWLILSGLMYMYYSTIVTALDPLSDIVLLYPSSCSVSLSMDQVC